MKISVYTVSLVSLAVFVFSSHAQADGITKVQLSTTPIFKMNRMGSTCTIPSHIAMSHVKHGRALKVSKNTNRLRSSNRKRIARAKRVHAKSMRAKKMRTKMMRTQKIQARRAQTNRIRNNKKNNLRSKIKRDDRGRYHRVRSGDSLYKISRRYGVSVKRIIRVNKLKNSAIKAGAMLQL